MWHRSTACIRKRITNCSSWRSLHRCSRTLRSRSKILHRSWTSSSPGERNSPSVSRAGSDPRWKGIVPSWPWIWTGNSSSTDRRCRGGRRHLKKRLRLNRRQERRSSVSRSSLRRWRRHAARFSSLQLWWLESSPPSSGCQRACGGRSKRLWKGSCRTWSLLLELASVRSLMPSLGRSVRQLRCNRLRCRIQRKLSGDAFCWKTDFHDWRHLSGRWRRKPRQTWTWPMRGLLTCATSLRARLEPRGGGETT
mmetsp:Transcript_142538/g.355275  ORF Transcript_142538/g.355275 Transcript_142538/m.355275 type:complete len:251 (+) Transcript_142538:2109-2861(+)